MTSSVWCTRKSTGPGANVFWLCSPDPRDYSLTLDQKVDQRLADSTTLDEAPRVLYQLLTGGYSVWTDGKLINTRALVKSVGRLRIEIRLNEHAPPHFHVLAGGDVNASFAIRDCAYLAGEISNRDRALVERWHAGARPLLIQKWNETRPSDCPVGLNDDVGNAGAPGARGKGGA